MSPRQVELVQQSWSQVAPLAEHVALLFYSRLFALDPELRALFHVDLQEQGRKLVAMLTTAVNALERPDVLLPVLRDLGRRHAGYGVRGEHYETVALALLWTLERNLGSAFTPEVKDAWRTTYRMVADVMKAADGEVRVRPAG